MFEPGLALSEREWTNPESKIHKIATDPLRDELDGYWASKTFERERVILSVFYYCIEGSRGASVEEGS